MEFKAEEWNRVKELFLAALVHEQPGDRIAWLRREEPSPSVREAVERLLDAHEEADILFRLDGALDHPSAAELGHLAAGTILAERFRVVRFLARGGMGEVYEALDLEFNAAVAIKTIRPEIADNPEALARFKREVHLARRVTHPNVCRIFDLFRHRNISGGGDVLFVSMELVHGNTLAAYLKERGLLEPAEALPLLRQILAGVDAAHQVGVLHRDLKPANILLELARDGSLRAAISDFGLAWNLNSSGDSLASGTGPMVIGTPEFMSPEQIEGRTLTPASDLYSLGLVIHRMITGVNVFAGDTPLLAALRRLHEVPPPPSLLVPELGHSWDDLVLRCLDPDPARRFSNALAVLSALPAPSPAATPQPTAVALVPAVETVILVPAHRWSAWFGWKSLTATAALLLLVGWGAIVLYRHHLRAHPVTGLTAVLADFVNTTGEPVFDRTMNIALSEKLQQTPFLNLMSDARIRLGLRYMGMPDTERLTQSVAGQVCRRMGAQAVLQGSIASTASGYTVILRALPCAAGDAFAVRQAQVTQRSQVVQALNQVADAIRPALGESAASIHKYDVPAWEATTPSLDALMAFSDGHRAWNTSGEAAALPYFEHAIALDPNFAMAYARLGTVYGNMGETQRSHDAIRKAYDLRDRVTERERFYIVSHFYAFVTGEIDREMATYEEWARAYPVDMAWTINLSVDYAMTGQFDKAIELQQKAIRDAPGNAPSYGDLAQLYLAVDRPDEALAVLDEAKQLHLQDANTRLIQYSLLFYRGDAPAMRQLVASAEQEAGIGDMLLAQQAATEDRMGDLNAGRDFALRAAALAQQQGNPEVSANWIAGEALRQAELGNTHVARELAARALATPKAAAGSDVQVLVAFTDAQTGETHQAEALLASLAHDHPLDSLVQSYWIPVIRARLALTEGHPEQTLQLLEPARHYDMGIFSPGQCMDAAYLRALALLDQHRGNAAAAEFGNILAHRGFVLNCPTSALATLGLARALSQSGDMSSSRAAYQDLFALWKDADPRAPLAASAQAEYRALR
ncbi:Serine/threonine protein kinase [Bryocella elongata]|uniref:Serine/threonine protein kinase n=2 Tax=Bryocella elongata TaxID=863522 RepID=A0A1H5US14_9BACT|nr:Serine/threonine protein kinase [Bryocella elongata]